MIHIKKLEEIEKMKVGGKILAGALHEVLRHIKPGVSELELDKIAEEYIVKHKAEPGFKRVPEYHHAICVSTNDVVVHGVPTGYRLQEGDVVGIDCGVFYEGLHTDMSETRRVSTINKQQLTNNKKDEIDLFLETGKRALEAGIQEARGGNRVGHISKAIQSVVEGAGYSVVRSLVGHGVGRQLHEEPEVPGYLAGRTKKTPTLRSGMTIAVEVIYNMGKSAVMHSGGDDWTIKTQDGSISGVFERTIAITPGEPVVLTA